MAEDCIVFDYSEQEIGISRIFSDSPSNEDSGDLSPLVQFCSESTLPECQAFQSLTFSDSPRSQRGRKCDPESHLFNSFIKKGKEVRGRHFKESMLKNVFRGLRSTFKSFLAGKGMKSRFRELYRICQSKPEEVVGIVNSGVWPRTERPLQPSTFSCFNSQCIRALLNDEVLKNFYVIYIEELFFDYNISYLQKSFKFKCCSENSHNYCCIMRWKALKFYLTEVIFEKFGIAPLKVTAKQDLFIDIYSF